MEDDSDDDDLVFEGDTLTWAAVAQACNANESRYSTSVEDQQALAPLKLRQGTKEKLPLMPLVLNPLELVLNCLMKMRKRNLKRKRKRRRKMILEMMLSWWMMMKKQSMWCSMMMRMLSSPFMSYFALFAMCFMLSFYGYAS